MRPVVVTGTITKSNTSSSRKIHVYKLNRAEYFLFQAQLNFRRDSNCWVYIHDTAYLRGGNKCKSNEVVFTS